MQSHMVKPVDRYSLIAAAAAAAHNNSIAIATRFDSACAVRLARHRAVHEGCLTALYASRKAAAQAAAQQWQQRHSWQTQGRGMAHWAT